MYKFKKKERKKKKRLTLTTNTSFSFRVNIMNIYGFTIEKLYIVRDTPSHITFL